jgi:cytochrome P450
VHTEASALALDALIETVTGADVAADVRAFAELHDVAEEALLKILAAPVVLPAAVPTPGNRKLATGAARVQALADRVIDARRRSPGVEIVSRLIDTARADRLRDEVVTMLVGGYQSTAAALSFTWYLLAQHPDATAEVRDEVDAVGVDDVARLVRTRMIVDESLRLYPPVWVIARRAARADTLVDAEVPRGASVWIAPYTLHRNPEHWERPEEFDPDRFAPERASGRHHHAYAPFGAGLHKCVGNHYALQVAVTAVATLLSRFDLSPPARPFTARTKSFTYPDGPPLRVSPRAR